jgi:hypothetical protein
MFRYDRPTDSISFMTFFDEGHLWWETDFTWPVVQKGIAKVTDQAWEVGKVYEIKEVHNIPAGQGGNPPYLSWDQESGIRR